MKKKKLIENIKYAIENCYDKEVLNDIYVLLIEFDRNPKTSSLKEFINNKMEKK